MSLLNPYTPPPPPDATNAQLGAYWLAVAEDDYVARRYDAATAAAHIAVGRYEAAAQEPVRLHVDALGLNGPKGSQLGSATGATQ